MLSKEENQLLLQTIRTLPPDGQGKVLQQFAQGLNDPALMDSAMRVLSAQAPVQALAGLAIAKDYAGSEDEAMGHLPLGGDGRISAGQTMLEGEAARNPPATKSDAKPDAKPLPMPPDGQTRESYASLVGDRLADQPGAEEAHYQAALAAYAGLSKRAGDTSGEFDAQRWNAAVKLAVEGSGTARELGLVPQPETDDARIQRMRNTFAKAPAGIMSDAGGQSPVVSDTETGIAAGDTMPHAGRQLSVRPTSASVSTQEQSPGKKEWNRTLPGVTPLSPVDAQKVMGEKQAFSSSLDDLFTVTQEPINSKNDTLAPAAISSLREMGKRLAQDPAMGEKLLQQSFGVLLSSDGKPHQLPGQLKLEDLDAAIAQAGLEPRRVWAVIKDTAEALRNGDPSSAETVGKIGAGVQALLTPGKFADVGPGLLLGLLSMQGAPDEAIEKIITASQQKDPDHAVYLWHDLSAGKVITAVGEGLLGATKVVGGTMEAGALAAGKAVGKAVGNAATKVGEMGGSGGGKDLPPNARRQTMQAEEESGKPRPGEEGKRKVFARAEVNGEEFTDVNQEAREEKHLDRPTLISEEVAAGEKRRNQKLPNGKMSEAHGEVAVIQRAYEAGKTKDQDMVMHVIGEEVCSHCKSDIASMADKAGLHSLTIYEDKTGKTYRWNRDTKRMGISK